MGSRSRSNILQPRTDAAAAREARSATAPRGRSGKAPWLLLVQPGSEMSVEAGAPNLWQSISVGPSAAGASSWANSQARRCRMLAISRRALSARALVRRRHRRDAIGPVGS